MSSEAAPLYNQHQLLKILCRIIASLEINLNLVPGRGNNNEEAQHRVNQLQKTLGNRSFGTVRTLIAKRKDWVEKKPTWRPMASTLQKMSTS